MRSSSQNFEQNKELQRRYLADTPNLKRQLSQLGTLNNHLKKAKKIKIDVNRNTSAQRSYKFG